MTFQCLSGNQLRGGGKPIFSFVLIAFDVAYRDYGHQWEKVASQIPGRTAKSCERYYYRVYKKGNEKAGTDARNDNDSENQGKKYMFWTDQEKEGKLWHVYDSQEPGCACAVGS